MLLSLFTLGKQAALQKLGMDLAFPSEAAAREHYENRNTVGNVAGAAGTLGGALGGGLLGGKVYGLPGALAGAMAGGFLGNKVLSAPAKVMYDAAHDIPQRAQYSLEDARLKQDIAAGLPAGVYQ